MAQAIGGRARRKGSSVTFAAATVLAGLSGAAVGVGGYTFLYANGASYLRDDPAACANCHVMKEHLDAWVKSSHREAATCNDCHAPHESLASKLWVKGLNGFNHSVAFTTNRFHEPIRIGRSNREVTERACRHCHQAVVQAIDHAVDPEDAMSCIRCHADVGHPQ